MISFFKKTLVSLNIYPLIIKMVKKLKITTPIHIYFYSIVIGIIAGLFSVLFSYGVVYFQNLIFNHIIHLKLPLPAGEEHLNTSTISGETNVLFLLILPAVGAFLSGVISHYFCPEAKGNGTDEIIKSFHYKGGYVSAKVPFFKALATIFTIGTGGSAGKEGPTMQIGAGIGSAFANILKAGDRARRALMIAGVAGGLGAVFRAPLGGAFTAVEIVYKEDIESDTVVPAFLASVSAYLTATKYSGNHSIFYIPEVEIHHFYELIIFVIFSFFSLGFGYLFTKIYKTIISFFESVSIHNLFKPIFGGLLVGVFIVFFNELLGDGLGFLQEFISGKTPISESYLWISLFFLLLAILKMIVTSITVGSGGSGGLFTPSLFIGGCMGASVAYGLLYFFPNIEISISAFILIGMAGFFAGIAHAPIAGMIMVCDIVGNYKLLPALMIVSVITATLSKWSIYKGQIENRFHSPAHYWDMNLNILKKILVGDIKNKIRKIAVIEPHILVHDLEERSLKIKATDFIVINTEGEYKGIFSLRNFHHTKETESIKYLLTVLDVCNNSIPPVNLFDNLSKALLIMKEHEIDKVAVVDDKNQVLGYVRLGDIIDIYHHYAK